MTLNIPNVLFIQPDIQRFKFIEPELINASIGYSLVTTFDAAVTHMSKEPYSLLIWDLDNENTSIASKKLSKNSTVSTPFIALLPEGQTLATWDWENYPPNLEVLTRPFSAKYLIAKIKSLSNSSSITKRAALSGSGAQVFENNKSSSDKYSVEDKLHLNQQLMVLGRLAGGVAHDINNVLGGILGYAEMVKLRFANKNPGLRKYIDGIISFSKRAGDLSKEILSFTRSGKNKISSINMHKNLNEVFDLLSHTIDRKYELKRELNAKLFLVLGDSTLIQNAVINIVLNARDAMINGGSISLQTHNILIKDGDTKSWALNVKPGDYLSLKITDEGPGIKDEHLSKIFQPFFTTKEKGKGTGLGLSSVYNTMKLHNGSVNVKSKAGEGTEFQLLFPLSIEGKSTEGVDTSADMELGSGNLLIVDDEKELCEILSEMLSDYGYKINTAMDGVQALEYYRKHSKDVDLVIIDMNLPRMNGKECFIAMKAINPRIKAILSTGFSLNEETENILDEGVMEFIQKPFEISQLVKLISKQISNKS